MDIDVIMGEIEWTMRFYGSPAKEAKVPGSRLTDQLVRIKVFLQQYERACEILQSSGLDKDFRVEPYHKYGPDLPLVGYVVTDKKLTRAPHYAGSGECSCLICEKKPDQVPTRLV